MLPPSYKRYSRPISAVPMPLNLKSQQSYEKQLAKPQESLQPIKYDCLDRQRNPGLQERPKRNNSERTPPQPQMKNSSLRSSSKEFIINKQSTLRLSSASQKLRQSLFHDPNDYSNGKQQYLDQLAQNLRELTTLKLWLEEKIRMQAMQFKNQLIIQQYHQIQQDQQMFKNEIQNVRNNQQPNLSIFEQSVLLLEADSKQIQMNPRSMEISYLKDLAQLKSQKSQEIEQTTLMEKEFSQVHQEFLFPTNSQISNSTNVFIKKKHDLLGYYRNAKSLESYVDQLVRV